MRFALDMILYRLVTLALVICVTWSSIASATAPPAQVATVVVPGFDPDGVQETGIFGNDRTMAYVTTLATMLGLPTSVANPVAPNQVAYTTYYGDAYPSYYTSQDIADVATAGQGVPRYALIMAKYAKHVMQRSGATQVNIFAVSFGGLVSRYMIEKDLEGLASSGKIARWISVEGVVAGNWAATNGGQVLEDYIEDHYEAATIDLQHMKYSWVEANLNNPRTSSNSPYFGQFPVHFWQAADDGGPTKILTVLSQKANDGVVLIEDAIFSSLPAGSKYLGLMPTVSAMNRTHDDTKDFEGIRAGIAAQLFGRKRVTITLEDVYVKTEKDGGARGQGEYVFGNKVFSPLAETLWGIDKPIHTLRSDNNTLPYFTMPINTTRTINMVWFDDMVMPNEVQLEVQAWAHEIDADVIYNIHESASAEDHQALAGNNTPVMVSAVNPGTYMMETADWRGKFRVSITEYPPFDTNSGVSDWELY